MRSICKLLLFIYVFFPGTGDLSRCISTSIAEIIFSRVRKGTKIMTVVRIGRRGNNVALRFNGSTCFTIMPIYGDANRRRSLYRVVDRATGHQNQFVTIANGASPIGTRDNWHRHRVARLPSLIKKHDLSYIATVIALGKLRLELRFI